MFLYGVALVRPYIRPYVCPENFVKATLPNRLADFAQT